MHFLLLSYNSLCQTEHVNPKVVQFPLSMFIAKRKLIAEEFCLSFGFPIGKGKLN